ncbi:MAG: hypothetical protein KAW52_00935 [candidate division Zixibacteria bacterium]|nr:hypothetical protein [candidate division Zixibacteria bacterium]
MSESKNIDMVKYRREFPFTKEITFFNHASFGPMPERSWKATQQSCNSDCEATRQ